MALVSGAAMAAQAEYPEESSAMQVEPGGWGITKLAGDDGRIEGGELVEAHNGRHFQASAGARLNCRHVRPRAGHGRDEAYDQISPAVVVA